MGLARRASSQASVGENLQEQFSHYFELSKARSPPPGFFSGLRLLVVWLPLVGRKLFTAGLLLLQFTNAGLSATSAFVCLLVSRAIAGLYFHNLNL